MDENTDNLADQQQELQIQVAPEVQGGRYANQMIVTHTQEEFILDFILASHPVAVLNSRVLVSPSHAKRIISVLQDNIARYEGVFGEIKSIMPSCKPDHIVAN
jgi:hypothetical protein